MTADQIRTVGKRRGRLGITLLIWFLVLSLLPLTLVSMVVYRNARHDLIDNAGKALAGVTELKADYIHSFFSRRQGDLVMQAQNESTLRFLEELRNAFAQSNLPAGEFVKSSKAGRIYKEGSRWFKNFNLTYGYHDIFLIDEKGNILFTVMEEDDLGTNLLTGKYADSQLAQALRKNQDAAQVVFSDFGRYEPSHNKVAGFVVGAVFDEYGDRIGSIAFQLPIDEIDRIMQLRTGMGVTEDAYLVGDDLLMRSNSILEDEETILGKKVDTQQIRQWQAEHGAGQMNRAQEEASIYEGRRGLPVLGIHKDIDVEGLHLAIIAELDESEALAYAFELRHTVMIMVVATSLVVLVIAAFLARRIVGPILALARGVSRVAAGDFEQEVTIAANNEIGLLADNFGAMLSSLRSETEMNARQNWLAIGMAGLDKEMRGEHTIAELADLIISYVCKYNSLAIGALFVKTGDGVFVLEAGFACNIGDGQRPQFRPGEGIVGQAVQDRCFRSVSAAPADYFTLRSGIVAGSPGYIHALPCIYGDEVVAALELGSFAPLNELQSQFFDKTADSIAISLSMAASRRQLADALAKAQQMAEELQSQQEELRVSNEELEEQAKRLQASEEELKAQQEELQAANEELSEKARLMQEVS